jgi:hypothetical protein
MRFPCVQQSGFLPANMVWRQWVLQHYKTGWRNDLWVSVGTEWILQDASKSGFWYETGACLRGCSSRSWSFNVADIWDNAVNLIMKNTSVLHNDPTLQEIQGLISHKDRFRKRKSVIIIIIKSRCGNRFIEVFMVFFKHCNDMPGLILHRIFQLT